MTLAERIDLYDTAYNTVTFINIQFYTVSAVSSIVGKVKIRDAAFFRRVTMAPVGGNVFCLFVCCLLIPLHWREGRYLYNPHFPNSTQNNPHRAINLSQVKDLLSS